MPWLRPMASALRKTPRAIIQKPVTDRLATAKANRQAKDSKTSTNGHVWSWLSMAASCSARPSGSRNHRRTARPCRLRKRPPKTRARVKPMATAINVNLMWLKKVPCRAVANGALLYEVRDHVAWVTINRPERRNAMSGDGITGLRTAAADAKDDDNVRVLVLTGAGEQAFCAGADLTGMRGDAGFVETHDARGELARLFHDLWGLGKPTIARVRGYALAGGFGLALSCDFVVAADDAQFGTPEINVGLWPYMITVPLVRSMPPKKVLELMLTGRRVSAEEADRIGFVNQVVPVDELDAAVDAFAATLASKSPAIVKLGRDSFYGVWDQSAEEALRLLHTMLTINTMTDDAAEGIAAFAEKRTPEWKGR